MKEIKTNFETGKRVIMWHWAKYTECMPLIYSKLVDDFLLYGDNPCIRFDNKKDAIKYAKDFIKK